MAQAYVAKPVPLGLGSYTAAAQHMEQDSGAAGCKPHGLGGRRFRHYRRSTTSKAPRKRTFIMHMSKYNAGLLPRQSGVRKGAGYSFLAYTFNIDPTDATQNNPADYGNGGAGHGRDPNLVSSHRVQTERFLLSRDMAVLAAAAALRPALLALHLSAHALVCTAAHLRSAQEQQQVQQQQRQQQQQEQEAAAAAAAAASLPRRTPSPTPPAAAPATRKRRSPFQAALQAAAHSTTPSPATSPPTSDPTRTPTPTLPPRSPSPTPPTTPDAAALHAALGHSITPPSPHLTLGPVLGQGAHGVVYSGTWAGRAAAIKLATHPAHPTSPHPASSAAASISREAHILPTLSHPNIVTCLHADPLPPTPAPTPAPHPTPLLVMELLPHGSLDTLLHHPAAPAATAALLPPILARHAPTLAPRTTPLTPAARRLVLLALLRDTAAALHHLHTRPAPIVHRDVKPENILISPAATAKLSDFGVALVLAPAPTPATPAPAHPLLAPAADIFGTVQYSAPEDLWAVGAAGTPRVGPAADVFSLACVLWEVLAGERPWQGLDTVQVMYGVGSGGKRLALEERRWPADLVALMRACWHADPAARPTAEQAGAVLERHVAALAAHVASE